MSKPKVYLFGRISELTYQEAVQWRNDLQAEIGYDFECLSPMRDKQELRKEEKLTGPYPDLLLCQPKAIILRDETDLQRCDVALGFSSPGNHPGKSSWMEMGYLWCLRKPMILVAEENDLEIRENPFLSNLPRLLMVKNMDEAIDVLYSLFNL